MSLIVDFNRQEYSGGDVLRATIEYLDEDGDELRTLGTSVDWIAAQLHAHVQYNSHLVSPPIHKRGVLGNGGKGTFSTSSFVHATPRTKQRVVATAMPDFSQDGVFVVTSLKNGGDTSSSSSSSMNESACLFSSKPCVVGANLNPSEASSHRYVFEATLPKRLPPSFRGHSVRYLYYLTIGVKLEGDDRPLQLTHVPFIVRCSLGDDDDDEEEEEPAIIGSNGEEDASDEMEAVKREAWWGTNCFPNPRLDKVDLCERAYVLEEEEEESRIRHDGVNGDDRDDEKEDDGNRATIERGIPTTPLVSHPSKRRRRPREPLPPFLLINAVQRSKLVARCAVFPTRGLRRGDTLTLKLDVSDADLTPTRIVVALETEERATREPPIRALFESLLAPSGGNGGLNPAPRRSSHLSATAAHLLDETSATGGASRSDASSWVRTVERCEKEMGNRVLTAVQIPTGNATPDFSTDLVCVRNYLRVEFVTSSATSATPLRLRIPLVVGG